MQVLKGVEGVRKMHRGNAFTNRPVRKGEVHEAAGYVGLELEPEQSEGGMSIYAITTGGATVGRVAVGNDPWTRFVTSFSKDFDDLLSGFAGEIKAEFAAANKAQVRKDTYSEYLQEWGQENGLKMDYDMDSDQMKISVSGRPVMTITGADYGPSQWGVRVHFNDDSVQQLFDAFPGADSNVTYDNTALKSAVRKYNLREIAEQAGYTVEDTEEGEAVYDDEGEQVGVIYQDGSYTSYDLAETFDDVMRESGGNERGKSVKKEMSAEVERAVDDLAGKGYDFEAGEGGWANIEIDGKVVAEVNPMVGEVGITTEADPDEIDDITNAFRPTGFRIT